jgi:uncharacterized membrane protein YfcA
MLLLLIPAAFAAGVVNALAGGGAFLTFPALLAAGFPAIDANVSSTVALFPGQFVSGWASRDVLRTLPGQWRKDLHGLALISLVGGSVGALLLLATPSSAFGRLVPWLLLFATAVFALGGRLTNRGGPLRLGSPSIKILQFAISIYGGYFGGGIGILVLAALAHCGLRDIRIMNGMKVILAALMSTAAAAIFALSSHVHWLETLVMMASAMAGGFAGARLGLVIPQTFIRLFVVAVGCVLTVYFFIKPA